MDMHSDPQYKTDDGSALRIWRDAAQNNFLTEREGRPIFDEVVYVEVISPGSGNSAPIFEVVRVLSPEMGINTPKHGVQYAQFKKYIEDFNESEKHDASLSGTPLSQWSEITRTMVASMKAQKIFTIDALASLPDSKLHVVGPDGRTWREKAKAYIENAKTNSYATSIAADLEHERQKSADLQSQVAALADQVRVLSERQENVNESQTTGRRTNAPVIPPPLAQPAKDPKSII